MNRRNKQWIKIAIACMVVVGLAVAVDKSVKQWRSQHQLAIERVDVLEAELKSATSADQQAELRAKVERARSSIPTMSNVRWWALGFAGILYGTSLLPGGMVLHRASCTLGPSAPLVATLQAQIAGHLGKYVPGKAMVVVIRAGRLAEFGVPLLTGSLAVFIETFSMMAVGAALAGVIIYCLPEVPRWIGWCSLAGGVAATLPTLPPLLRWITEKVNARTAIEPSERSPLRPANTDNRSALTPGSSCDLDQEGSGLPIEQGLGGWALFASIWIWQATAWLLIGGAFALILYSIPGDTSGDFPGDIGQSSPMVVFAAAVASIALAMVAGFASLLPGGAGVRELTLTIILSPVVGESRALLAAVMARLLFLVVELVAVAVVSRFRSGQPENLIMNPRNLD